MALWVRANMDVEEIPYIQPEMTLILHVVQDSHTGTALFICLYCVLMLLMCLHMYNVRRFQRPYGIYDISVVLTCSGLFNNED